MKRFLILLSCFLLPFILLGIITKIYYTKGSDLSRIGKISADLDYRKIFHDEYNLKRDYTNISELDLNNAQQFKFLTIGDSYSNLGNVSYQNYIAKIDSCKVVNFDAKSYNIEYFNPIQFLIQAVNGNLFETLEVDYVILQSVERHFVRRSININQHSTLNINDIQNLELNIDDVSKKSNKDLSTFFEDSKKFLWYNLLYNFDDNAFYSDVYKVPLTNEMFSKLNNDLLFYYQDIENMKFVNENAVHNLNNELNSIANKLSELGIKLIVLPSPDKFDLYYNYIFNNHYPENYFFEYLRNEKKDYIFIDAKEVLAKMLIDEEKDVYYFYDTHWSPKAAKKIAENLLSVINR